MKDKNKVWKKVFKKYIKNQKKEAKIEFNKYKKSTHIIHLQQAGNKLFSAVEKRY